MENIKFRIWAGGKSYGDQLLYFDFGDIQTRGLWFENKNEPPGDEKRFICVGGSGCEEPHNVMQFTGLIDKNGKDVFEGDIVLSEQREQGGVVISKKGVVEYTAPCFQINGQVKYSHPLHIADVKNQNSYTVTPEQWYPNCSMVGGGDDILEVIGNIYENPNLINGKIQA